MTVTITASAIEWFEYIASSPYVPVMDVVVIGVIKSNIIFISYAPNEGKCLLN